MTRAGIVSRLLKLHQEHKRRLTEQAVSLRRRVEQSALNLTAQKQVSGGDAEWPALAAAADVVRDLPRATQRKLLSMIPAELATEFRRELYSIDSLPTLPARLVQRILQRCRTRDLAVALLGAAERLIDTVLRNVSTRAAAMITEDLESLASANELSASDVASARDAISSIVRAEALSGPDAADDDEALTQERPAD